MGVKGGLYYTQGLRTVQALQFWAAVSNDDKNQPAWYALFSSSETGCREEIPTILYIMGKS